MISDLWTPLYVISDFKSKTCHFTYQLIYQYIATSVQLYYRYLVSYHNSKDVLSADLIVQSICCVHDTSTRIDPKHPHACRINTAMDGVAQLCPFILVPGPDAQDLSVGWCILRHQDFICTLRENGSVVIAVQNLYVNL